MAKNILKRVYRKSLFFLDKMYVALEKKQLYKKIKNDSKKNNLYLFSNPIHSNLGDQAQTYCILKVFEEFYADYNVICVPCKIGSDKIISLIKDVLKEQDKIFIHSGYLIFDPHPQLPFIAKVVSTFYDHKIVILPQTVNLQDKKVLEMVSEAFLNHEHLTLMCRDEISYKNASNLFNNVKLILWPDFVTSLIGSRSFSNKREGVLFCLRDDLEKHYSDSELDNLKKKFNNIKVHTYDTTIIKSSYSWKYFREKLINKVLNKFSKYQLIITDRYHGTIFSQITSTPVIVLSSSDHKLSSGVKWFPKEKFEKNVFFANDLNQAFEYANEILKRNGKIYQNDSYFKDTFFSRFSKAIDN